MPERVSFATKDGVTIVGDWYAVPNAASFALLLHMRPATKESWRVWAQKLQDRGVACLAIDQRGHGESTNNGLLDYKTFGDEESRGKRFDVEAALGWLRAAGAVHSQMSVWGASIGANLAIRCLMEHADIARAAALSPGINFRGVSTDDAIVALHEGQSVVLVASEDDPHDSFASARKLHHLAPERTHLIERANLGHGTDMLDRDPALFEEILEKLA